MYKYGGKGGGCLWGYRSCSDLQRKIVALFTHCLLNFDSTFFCCVWVDFCLTFLYIRLPTCLHTYIATHNSKQQQQHCYIATMAFPPYTGYAFTGLDSLHADIYPAISAAQTPSLKQPGKAVLVTGASRGIGRAIAIQYAHANVATIILAARSADKLEEVKKEIEGVNGEVKVLVKAVDVTSVESVQALGKEVEGEVGRLDVLVNNAGAAGAWVPLAESKPEDWWWDYEVSVKAPYLFMHALLPLMVKTAEKHGGKADIINMTSVGAHAFIPGASAYHTCKLASLRLSEFVKVEYGDKGIICVGMHPGGVQTQIAEGKTQLEGYLNDTPELAAGFTVWLTAENREWLSGRYVAAPWDVEKLESMKEEIVDGDKLLVRMVV
ncbi:unnamed protein product [Periconia digitata]|uniref:Uncharacterized protein n=1 Tax=Periconia digitata TaxID=1303443 RepID=A0A9W4UV03_9PLEO|nr:unnamed protein product [Periconia digitata]